MTQQFRQPRGVLDIGLAAGHVLDVLGIEHPDGETGCQDVVNRRPEHASHNVAKKLAAWEYVSEIQRTQLRRTRGGQDEPAVPSLAARPDRGALDPGSCHAYPTSAAAPAGDGHV